MKPEIVTALSVTVVAVVSSVATLLSTRMLTRADQRKTQLQIDREALHRQTEKNRADVSAILAELLSITDPEARGRPDYRQAVVLIRRAQLLLDPRVYSGRKVDEALKAYRVAVARHYETLPEPGQERDETATVVHETQSRLIEVAQIYLAPSAGTGLIDRPAKRST